MNSTTPAPGSDEPRLGLGRRLVAAIPPWPILLLSAFFVIAATFTLAGPVNILAWRGGTFPPTQTDRPAYQQNLKNVTRVLYETQPDPAVYFGQACGGADAALTEALPELLFDDTLPYPSGPVLGPVAPGDADSTAVPPKALDRDAFGDTVACDGRWNAAFISYSLATSGLPLFGDAAEPSVVPDAVVVETAAEVSANPWLVTDVNQLWDVYQQRGALFTNEDFSPQVGDIIFYRYPGNLGVHANMVVAVGNEWVTIGGDELGRVGLASMGLRHRSGIMGYGATGYFAEEPLPLPGAPTAEDAPR